MRRVISLTRYTALATAVYMATTALASAQQLEEIVVQAERRTADMQKTAISMAAFNEKAIAQMGVTNTRELATYIPNLQVEQGFAYGDINPGINIRGIGGGNNSGSFGISSEKSVGIYIDGLYFARQFNSIINVTDMEQIEVLRGPQGTLFGRNSPGGAISYRTKKANVAEGFAGYAELALGKFGRKNLKAAVNIPLSETWAVRASLANNLYDGYVMQGPKHLGNVDEQTGNISAQGKLSDKLTIDISASYTRNKSNGNPGNLIGYNDNPNYVADPQRGPTYLIGALEAGLVKNGQPRLATNDPRIIRGRYNVPDYCVIDDGDPLTRTGDYCDNFRKGNNKVLSVKAAYDYSNNIRFTYLSGVIDGYMKTRTDALNLGIYARDFSQGYRSAQNEIQLNLNYDRWHAVGGLIHFAEKGTEHELTTEAGVPNNVAQGPYIRAQRREESYTVNTNSWALYSQGSYSILDSLELTAGLRRTHDGKKASMELLPVGAGLPTFYNDIATGVSGADRRNILSDGTKSSASTDFRLAMQWNPLPDLMLFISRTKAFKAAQPDDSSAEKCLTPLTSGPTAYPVSGCGGAGARGYIPMVFVRPETVMANEVGVRSEWFSKRLRANLTFFETKWRDRQTGSGTNVNGFTVLSTVNANPIKTKGFEADFTAALTDSLKATYAYGRTSAWQTFLEENLPRAPYVVTSTAVPTPYTTQTAADNAARRALLVGQTRRYILDSVAPYNWTAGLEYSLRLANGDKLTTNWNYVFRKGVSSFNEDTSQENSSDPGNENPDYHVINLSSSYAPKSGKWSLSMNISNLMDTQYTTGKYSYGPGFYFGANNGAFRINPNIGITAAFAGAPRSVTFTGRIYF